MRLADVAFFAVRMCFLVRLASQIFDMFKIIRISVLLFVLAIVALSVIDRALNRLNGNIPAC